MFTRSTFSGGREITSFPGNNHVWLQHLALALLAILTMATAAFPGAAAQTRELAVSIARRDLRPLAQVTVQLTGAANPQGVTDANGRVTFPGLPTAGAITVTPSRSGFRFEPTQLTI